MQAHERHAQAQAQMQAQAQAAQFSAAGVGQAAVGQVNSQLAMQQAYQLGIQAATAAMYQQQQVAQQQVAQQQQQPGHPAAALSAAAAPSSSTHAWAGQTPGMQVQTPGHLDFINILQFAQFGVHL